MKRRDFVKAISAVGTGLLFRSGSPFSLHAQQLPPDPAVKRVLVMFKCHFDAGFIDTQTAVVHQYFAHYFPRAIEIARAQNADGKRRYVWTTGSWLLFEYLEQASPGERKIMEQAIVRGEIAWHALPFTWQTEMLSQSMIEGSLVLSQSLDRRFGKVTTGAKMTDVPGHTRGIIPPLAKHGVTLLEIGVNSASSPAQLPPIFLWKDPSGASLPVMYHLDYGGIATVPGSDLALVTWMQGDNMGPHNPEEIAAAHAALGKRFPNAEITACSLSDMANSLHPYRDRLPVVTQEIGDTWIYGCPSDPLKVARYREVARLREAWIAQGHFQNGDATDLALLRHLLLEVEHTWGGDPWRGACFCAGKNSPTVDWDQSLSIDYDKYKPADVARMLEDKNYKFLQFTWEEKRQDLLDAVATLPATLRAQAQVAMKGLVAVEPVSSPRAVALATGQLVETPHFILGIDAQSGAITRLRNKATGHEWAGKTNPIALFTYQTLSQEDYKRFISAYTKSKDDWVYKDFGKPEIEKCGAVSQEWQPTSALVSLEETASAHRILVRMEIQDEEAYQSGRASFPRKIFLELLLPKASPEIHLTLSCFQKPATRLPEALWLTFNPIAQDPRGWTLNKTGESVSPFDVAVSGNRHMHALEKGFAYQEPGHRFAVETIDAPVVAVGERSALLFSNSQPDLSAGIHSNLFNNAWGTNYIMWYGEDMRFRYTLRS
jgi:hypothetical protein